ncbi:hypothetical protein [Psychrobacillus sp. NPDC093180]|uniref:DUF7669 domain-containing protein n=1 Tax=Psychrobacillus sp. NPDC093180 TaxID=3364489 RepID=UPI0037FC4779
MDKTNNTSARDEIIEVVKFITKEREVKSFTVREVLNVMRNRETNYKDSTIRTHIISKCCANAPKHHGTVSNDFERIGRGIYRIIE